MRNTVIIAAAFAALLSGCSKSEVATVAVVEKPKGTIEEYFACGQHLAAMSDHTRLAQLSEELYRLYPREEIAVKTAAMLMDDVDLLQVLNGPEIVAERNKTLCERIGY